MKTVGDWFKAGGSFLYFIADLQLSQNIYRQRSPLLAAAVAGSFPTGKREDVPAPFHNWYMNIIAKPYHLHY